MTDTVYTIGHSTHPIGTIIGLLQAHGVTAVADVRSHPVSRRNPQFNREALKTALRAAGIDYVFLGKELGARSEDRACYRDGRVQYGLLARTDLFRHGIARVKEGARSRRVALLCAEKEPLDCHRTILVARVLSEEGIAVKHILSDGAAESHDETMARLMRRLGLATGDLFGSGAPLAAAYARREAEVAYRDPAAETSSKKTSAGKAPGR